MWRRPLQTFTENMREPSRLRGLEIFLGLRFITIFRWWKASRRMKSSSSTMLQSTKRNWRIRTRFEQVYTLARLMDVECMHIWHPTFSWELKAILHVISSLKRWDLEELHKLLITAVRPAESACRGETWRGKQGDRQHLQGPGFLDFLSSPQCG